LSTHPFASMYETRAEDREMFGDHYVGKPTQEYGEYVTVARYEKIEGDGQPVEIDEVRLPARFYRIRVLDSLNSIGEPKHGFILTTGSGYEMGKFAAQLAVHASMGMLGLGRE
jgi:hypothetical protein